MSPYQSQESSCQVTKQSNKYINQVFLDVFLIEAEQMHILNLILFGLFEHVTVFVHEAKVQRIEVLIEDSILYNANNLIESLTVRRFIQISKQLLQQKIYYSYSISIPILLQFVRTVRKFNYNFGIQKRVFEFYSFLINIPIILCVMFPLYHFVIKIYQNLSNSSKMQPEHQQLWGQVCSQMQASSKKILESGQITVGGKTMHFVHKQKGDRPSDGYMLVFGLHGGGGVPKDVNDQQFSNHKNLYGKYLPDGSIWVAPRSVEDAPDMWRKPYMEDFLYGITHAFTTTNLVNPNKVFLTGYSAGGDGVYHMAPRMADHFAGAAMMAGHPNKVDLVNIRNLPFSIVVGGKDTPYNRNVLAQQYIDKIDQLHNEYGGFEQKSDVVADKPHWMDFEQKKVFPWLFEHERKTYPDLVLFKEHPDRKKNVLYYVRVEQRGSNDLVEVEKNGNKFSVTGDHAVKIRVNRDMIDYNSNVQIWHNGQQTFNTHAIVRPDIMQRTLQERLDPFYIFDDEFISVPGAPLNQGRSQQELQATNSEPFDIKHFYPDLQQKVSKIKPSIVEQYGCGDMSTVVGAVQKSGIPQRLVRKINPKLQQQSECTIF